MKKIKIFTFLMLLSMFLPLSLHDQKEQNQEQKVIKAFRANGDITIDGILDEEVWQQKGYSDFTMSDPTDGAEPTEKTEIWVAYEKTNLYVAARLHDSKPELISSRLGIRDDFVDSDWFIFAVDPYYDRRTGEIRIPFIQKKGPFLSKGRTLSTLSEVVEPLLKQILAGPSPHSFTAAGLDDPPRVLSLKMDL